MSEKLELSRWLEDQKHLPEVLRDFSNQKEVFAIIERIFSRHLPPGDQSPRCTYLCG